jgi:hypothetical protein
VRRRTRRENGEALDEILSWREALRGLAALAASLEAATDERITHRNLLEVCDG